MASAKPVLFDWLLPMLMSCTLGVLGWMSININRISENLAVAVYKLDEHERRIINLEIICREYTHVKRP